MGEGEELGGELDTEPQSRLCHYCLPVSRLTSSFIFVGVRGQGMTPEEGLLVHLNYSFVDE